MDTTFDKMVTEVEPIGSEQRPPQATVISPAGLHAGPSSTQHPGRDPGGELMNVAEGHRSAGGDGDLDGRLAGEIVMTSNYNPSDPVLPEKFSEATKSKGNNRNPTKLKEYGIQKRQSMLTMPTSSATGRPHPIHPNSQVVHVKVPEDMHHLAYKGAAMAKNKNSQVIWTNPNLFNSPVAHDDPRLLDLQSQR